MHDQLRRCSIINKLDVNNVNRSTFPTHYAATFRLFKSEAMESINSQSKVIGELDNRSSAVVPSFEKTASEGGIQDAVRHLYRAKRWLLIAHTEHSCSKSRQTLIKEYFM